MKLTTIESLPGSATDWQYVILYGWFITDGCFNACFLFIGLDCEGCIHRFAFNSLFFNHFEFVCNRFGIKNEGLYTVFDPFLFGIPTSMQQCHPSFLIVQTLHKINRLPFFSKEFICSLFPLNQRTQSARFRSVSSVIIYA